MSYNFEFTNGILTGTSASSGSAIGRKLYTFTNGVLTNVEDTTINLNVRNAFVFNNGILTARTSASTSGSTSFEAIPYFQNPIDSFNNATAISTSSNVYSTPESSSGNIQPSYFSGVSGDYIFGHRREGSSPVNYFIVRKNIRTETSGCVAIPSSSLRSPLYFPMSDDYGISVSGARSGASGSITFSNVNWTSGSAAIVYRYNYTYGLFPSFSGYGPIGVAKDVEHGEVYLLIGLIATTPPEVPPVDLIRYVGYAVNSASVVFVDEDASYLSNRFDSDEYADMGDGNIGFVNYFQESVLTTPRAAISIVDFVSGSRVRTILPVAMPTFSPKVNIAPEYYSGCSIAVHCYNTSSSMVSAFRVYTGASAIENVFSLTSASWFRPIEMSFSKTKVFGSYYDPSFSGCTLVYDFSTGSQIYSIPQSSGCITMIAKSLDDIGNNMIVCVSGSTSGSIYSGSIIDALYRVNSTGGSTVIHRFDDEGLWAKSARDLRLYDEKITYSQDDEDVKIVIFN
jgi:hypothetical protein